MFGFVCESDIIRFSFYTDSVTLRKKERRGKHSLHVLTFKSLDATLQFRCCMRELRFSLMQLRFRATELKVG